VSDPSPLLTARASRRRSAVLATGLPGAAWSTVPEIESASPELFDPHLGRFIAKVRSIF